MIYSVISIINNHLLSIIILIIVTIVIIYDILIMSSQVLDLILHLYFIELVS
jgi:hypothetical protein